MSRFSSPARTPRSPLLADATPRLRSPSPVVGGADKSLLNGKLSDVKPIPSIAPTVAPHSPLIAPLSPPSSSSRASASPSPAPPEVPESNAPPEESEPPPDTIDMETFNQILELDEDETHDFSVGMVSAYFSQVTSTFDEMEDAFKRKDLEKLSSLGHFLKGSSAALGVTKVQASCEQIQHYGKHWDEQAGVNLTDEVALKKIEPLLVGVKSEYNFAEKWLKDWYLKEGIDVTQVPPE